MEHPKPLLLSEKKPRKKKASVQEGEQLQLPAEGPKLPTKKGKKASKRVPEDEVLGSAHRLTKESLVDSSSFEDKYQALSRKYTILEREHYGLGRELESVEDEIRILEEEKVSLLDELVVLEGLVDPSNLQHQC